MTKGETLFLILAIATFVSFGLMLAYHDHQYRATKRIAAPRTAEAASDSRAHA